MSCEHEKFSIEVEKTEGKCPIGEKVGAENLASGKIPVISCEGACIRGDIARLAANMIAKEDPYRRGCHGEILAVPDSAIYEWAQKAEKVVLIDGCFLRCHGRLLENVLGKDRLVQFDALAVYQKYSDIFEMDKVPYEERLMTARQVADHVLAKLNEGPCCPIESGSAECSCCCG